MKDNKYLFIKDNIGCVVKIVKFKKDAYGNVIRIKKYPKLLCFLINLYRGIVLTVKHFFTFNTFVDSKWDQVKRMWKYEYNFFIITIIIYKVRRDYPFHHKIKTRFSIKYYGRK